MMLRAALLALAICLAAGAARAEPPAVAPDRTALDELGDRALEAAQRAILIGGVLIYNHRHALAGGVIGCATGAALAGTSALALGVATGGLAAPAGPGAAALGCGVGALGGAMLGARMDDLSMP
jgi:hypothetical protein